MHDLEPDPDKLTLEQYNNRISALRESIEEIKKLKRANPLTARDKKDMSDNYYQHLEWDWSIDICIEEIGTLTEDRDTHYPELN